MNGKDALQILLITIAMVTALVGINYIDYLNAKRRGKRWSLYPVREPLSILTYNRREFALLAMVVVLFFALAIAAMQLGPA